MAHKMFFFSCELRIFRSLSLNWYPWHLCDSSDVKFYDNSEVIISHFWDHIWVKWYRELFFMCIRDIQASIVYLIPMTPTYVLVMSSFKVIFSHFRGHIWIKWLTKCFFFMWIRYSGHYLWFDKNDTYVIVMSSLEVILMS